MKRIEWGTVLIIIVLLVLNIIFGFIQPTSKPTQNKVKDELIFFLTDLYTVEDYEITFSNVTPDNIEPYFVNKKIIDLQEYFIKSEDFVIEYILDDTVEDMLIHYFERNYIPKSIVVSFVESNDGVDLYKFELMLSFDCVETVFEDGVNEKCISYPINGFIQVNQKGKIVMFEADELGEVLKWGPNFRE